MHIDSYIFSEEICTTIIVFLLLRLYLRKPWINKYYLPAICKIFKLELLNFNNIDLIIICFTQIAKSVSVLSFRQSNSYDRHNLSFIIAQGRQSFQRLHEAGILVSKSNPYSQAIQPKKRKCLQSRMSSSAVNVTGSRESSVNSEDSVEKKTSKDNKFQTMMTKPNMHIRLHFNRLMTEYDTIYNYIVLVGENKHKFVFLVEFCL